MQGPPIHQRDPKRQLAEFTRQHKHTVRSSGGGRVELTLSLPPNACSKNNRNWKSKAAATKVARKEAFLAGLAARAQGMIVKSWWGAAAHVQFFVPDNRRRDPSNLMDRCHPFWDGLQQAGLYEDDCRLVPNHVSDPIKVSAEPRVEIVLYERVDPDVILERDRTKADALKGPPFGRCGNLE